MKLDPFGVLFGFGVSMMVCGWWYRTPFPVQPMKAAGAVATTQATQTALLTPGAVHAAGLVTGVLWLLLGTTGLAQRLTRWIGRPVTQGVVLGLGLAFMAQGTRLMADNAWLAAPELAIAGGDEGLLGQPGLQQERRPQRALVAGQAAEEARDRTRAEPAGR
jgi:predicted benzoate:H+ symporter BenE